MNTSKETLALTEALMSKSSSINVQNTESDINRFYHMDVPFQVTIEYCSGPEPEDYVNVVTLSADRAVLYQESSRAKNYTDTKAILHFLAESMIHTLLYPKFGAAYQIRGLLCAFMSYLSSPQNYHCSNICPDTSSDFLIISRITHLFEERDGRISRTEFEKLLNYSGDYLNRIINKYTGMCLYDYGMTFCLKKAAKYLTETNESITTIAENCTLQTVPIFIISSKKNKE